MIYTPAINAGLNSTVCFPSCSLLYTFTAHPHCTKHSPRCSLTCMHCMQALRTCHMAQMFKQRVNRRRHIPQREAKRNNRSLPACRRQSLPASGRGAGLTASSTGRHNPLCCVRLRTLLPQPCAGPQRARPVSCGLSASVSALPAAVVAAASAPWHMQLTAASRCATLLV